MLHGHIFSFCGSQRCDAFYLLISIEQLVFKSITPLKLFIPCLLRVESGFSSCEPRPLHALLRPLLQTARSSSNKYHVELPKILSNGGGAGEIEEMTMWYALNYERADDELWTRTSAIGQGPWMDEKWRTGWIERMERRESVVSLPLEPFS